MYRTAEGEEIFVIDGHAHFWDGSPANQKNIHGKQFIECFYAYHSNLSPPGVVGRRNSTNTRQEDVRRPVRDGYDDMAILQPTYLTDFYKNGFNTTERNSAMKKSIRTALSSTARSIRATGRRGSRISSLREHKIKGVKLYTAEWRGESKGYKLTDPASNIISKLREARHQEHPRPQGADDHAAESRRV